MNSRPSALMLCLVAASAAVMTACSSGQISQTAVQVAAVNGNSGQSGPLAFRDVRLDYPGALGGEPGKYTNKKGGTARLLFTAVNLNPATSDTLLSINTDAGKVRIIPAEPGAATPELAPQVPLIAAAASTEHDAGAHSVDPATKPILVEISDLSRDLTPGLTFPVTFTFAKNKPLTISVPVDVGTDIERHQSEKSGSSEEKKDSHGGGH